MTDPQPVAPQPAGAALAALDDAVTHAQRCASAGDLHGVLTTLDGPLRRLGTDTPTASAVDAAVLFAHALAGTGDDALAVRWATWAHQAAQASYAPEDPRRLRPTQVHAAVLAKTGDPTHAVVAYQDLVHLLTATDGPSGVRTLLAQADLAAALHRRGSCAAAHTTLREALTRWRTYHGRRDPATKLCVRLALMYRDCGEVGLCQQLFAEARNDAPTPQARDTVNAHAQRPASPDHHLVCTHLHGTRPTYRPTRGVR